MKTPDELFAIAQAIQREGEESPSIGEFKEEVSQITDPEEFFAGLNRPKKRAFASAFTLAKITLPKALEGVLKENQTPPIQTPPPIMKPSATPPAAKPATTPPKPPTVARAKQAEGKPTGKTVRITLTASDAQQKKPPTVDTAAPAPLAPPMAPPAQPENSVTSPFQPAPALKEDPVPLKEETHRTVLRPSEGEPPATATRMPAPAPRQTEEVPRPPTSPTSSVPPWPPASAQRPQSPFASAPTSSLAELEGVQREVRELMQVKQRMQAELTTKETELQTTKRDLEEKNQEIGGLYKQLEGTEGKFVLSGKKLALSSVLLILFAVSATTLVLMLCRPLPLLMGTSPSVNADLSGLEARIDSINAKLGQTTTTVVDEIRVGQAVQSSANDLQNVVAELKGKLTAAEATVTTLTQRATEAEDKAAAQEKWATETLAWFRGFCPEGKTLEDIGGGNFRLVNE